METRFGKNSTTSHITLDRMRRSRFVYWVVVSSLSTLVVLTTLSALFSKQFTTTAILPISAQPVAIANGEPDHIQQILIESIKLLNRDSELAAIFYGTEPDANPEQLDSIRRRLTYALLPTTDNAPLSIQVNFLGNGSASEQSFLERFIEALDKQIGQQISKTAFPMGVKPTPISKNRQSQVDGIRTSLTRTFQHMEHLAEQLATAKESVQLGIQQQRIGPDVGQQRQLMFELDQLQSQKTELLGKFTVTHPTLVELQQRIEAIKQSISEIETSVSTSSPYQPASYQRSADVQIWLDLAAKLKDLDVEQIQSSLIQLEQSWNGLLWELEQSKDADPILGDERNDFRARPIQTKPLGLLGQRFFPLMMALLSLGIGVLVASIASQHLTDRGFDSPGELSEVLGLPIIGVVALVRNSRRQETKADMGFRRLLKLSEILLFTTLLIVVAIAVRSPEIRQALLENPIQALCQVVWAIRG